MSFDKKQLEAERAAQFTQHYYGEMEFSAPMLIRHEKFSTRLTIDVAIASLFKEYGAGQKVRLEQRGIKTEADLNAWVFFAKKAIMSGIPILGCIPARDPRDIRDENE